MASSNRHWPSMFKSKPYSSHHPWKPDINSNPHCQRPTYPSGSEERSPDPKPRWNPKPEQIRILEAIFNSGMVNPPRDEIRRIRVQLQEYGQVGDANVFYWFQNRKSRSKHKQRHLHNSKHELSSVAASTASAVLPSSSSSSSSEKSPPKRCTTTSATASASASASATNKLFNSPSGCVNQNQNQNQNQNYLPSHHGDFLSDPFFYPMQLPPATGAGLFSQGLYVPEFSSNIVQVPDQAITPCGPRFLFSQLLNQTTNSSKKQQGQKKLKLGQQPQTYDIATTTCAATAAAQGGGMGVAGCAAAKTTVFINNVAVDVASGPFNVREAFGEEAVLIHSSTGQPMLTDQWGVTLQALQPGAFYYLV